MICSVETDTRMVEKARKAGALAYVFKTHVARDLVRAAKSAFRREVFISPE
jgi:DNA-binding NarL/FixJ family response regulator